MKLLDLKDLNQHSSIRTKLSIRILICQYFSQNNSNDNTERKYEINSIVEETKEYDNQQLSTLMFNENSKLIYTIKSGTISKEFRDKFNLNHSGKYFQIYSSIKQQEHYLF